MENALVEYLFGLALTLYPTFRILKRTGLNTGYVSLVFIPGFIGVFILVIVLATTDWPIQLKRGE
jgi:hypothetical protein